MVYSENLFLTSLADADRALLQQCLQLAWLRHRDVIAIEGRAIERIYFPITAIISLLITGEDGKTIETTTIGRDGVMAASPALDSRVSLSRGVVKVGGTVLICEATAFKRAALSSPTLLSAIMRHEQTMFQQTQQNGACASMHSIQQQLARMLLRTRDLTGENILPLTQGYIAELLGVRRTSITEAARNLRRKHVIRYARGKIEIASVIGLRQQTCECYGVIRRHYNALHRIEHEEQ